MSFNISTDRYVGFGNNRGIKQIFAELKKAEANGLNEIIFQRDDWHDDKLSEGQIFHYIPEKDDQRFLENIWVLDSYPTPDVWRPIGDGGGKTFESYGTVKFVKFQGENYLKPKQKVLILADVLNSLEKKTHGAMRVGAFMISPKSDYGRITKIYIKETVDNELTSGDSINNPHRKVIMKDEVFIDYEFEKKKRINLSNIVFDGKATIDLERFFSANHYDAVKWVFISEPNLKSFQERIDIMEERDELFGYEDALLIGDGGMTALEKQSNDNTSKALVGLGSKEHLEGVYTTLDRRKDDALATTYAFQRKIVLLEEKLKDQLAKKKDQLAHFQDKLNAAIVVFKKEMEKIHRLIATLEIYMGVHEEVIQIAEGEPAGVNEPICIRQMQLFMDEEFGDPSHGGINFQKINDFDEWLVESGNYSKVAPEEKCIVVMRPRRQMKDYEGFDAETRAKFRRLDQLAYIIIRNGGNIYRIYSQHIEIQNRLFPLRAELQGILDRMNDLELSMESSSSEYEHEKFSGQMDSLEGKVFYYKRCMLLLQGIITRTEIYQPLPMGLNVLDVNTHGDHIKFIYDDEATLPDGRLRYDDWLKKINSSIVKGTRIFAAYNGSSNNWKERIGLEWSNEHNCPPMPEDDVYTLDQKRIKTIENVTEFITEEEWKAYEKKWKDIIDTHGDGEENKVPAIYWKEKKWEKTRSHWLRDDKKIEVDVLLPNPNFKSDSLNGISKWYNWPVINKKIERVTEHLKFSYNPNDTVYGKWGRTSNARKVNLTFIVKPDKDKEIINYDALLLEDVDFYINSRVDRVNYLHMMPVLWGLRSRLAAEKEWEKHFVRGLHDKITTDVPKLSGYQFEAEIWEAIEWWKNEVVTVFKRPITKDDKKAITMIEQRVKSVLKKKYKLKIEAGFDNRKKVLYYSRGTTQLVCTGLTKAQFINEIWDRLFSKWSTSKAEVGRTIAETKNPEYVKLANESAGMVVDVRRI